MVERKVYIAKHALTKGIVEINDWRFLESDKSYIYAKESYSAYKVGTDAFFDREEALKNACKKRDDKVKSLKKQIEKLEGMRFE